MTNDTSSIARQCCYFLWLLLSVRIAILCAAMLTNWAEQSLFGQNYVFVDTVSEILPLNTLRTAFSYDNLLVSMAYSTIVDPYALTQRAATWPKVFQEYLYDNSYKPPSNYTPYHLPPLSTLQFMAGGWLVTQFHPITVICIQLACLFALMGGVLKHPLLATIPRWIRYSIFATCYPAFYAWFCGNLVAVLAAIGVCAYILSICSQQWRYIGYIGLVCAINFRPNIALVALLELVHYPLPYAARRVAMLAVTTVAVFVVCWGVAYTIDPNYTLANIRHALQIYHHTFAIGPLARPNNYSLYGIIQFLFYDVLHSDVLHKVFTDPEFFVTLPLAWQQQNAFYLTIANIICFGLLCVVLYTLIKKRLTPIEACFLLLAFNALYTPVYSRYHMLAFVAILLIAVTKITTLPLRQIWFYFLILNCVGLVSVTAVWVFVLAILLSVLVVMHMARIMPSNTHLAGAVTLLLLSPIPAPLQATIMLTTSCTILARAYRLQSLKQ